MSKILGVWDERVGVENCDQILTVGLYKTLLESPHEDGLMPVSVYDKKEHLNDVHLVPMEEIILFGLKGNEVNQYGKDKKIKN